MKLEDHACATGDCVHEKQYECSETLIDFLKDREQKLLEVVRFYAEKKNWSRNHSAHPWNNFSVCNDDELINEDSKICHGGKRARAVLKELEIE